MNFRSKEEPIEELLPPKTPLEEFTQVLLSQYPGMAGNIYECTTEDYRPSVESIAYAKCKPWKIWSQDEVPAEEMTVKTVRCIVVRLPPANEDWSIGIYQACIDFCNKHRGRYWITQAPAGCAAIRIDG